jgi:hypothetical protein
MYHSAAKCVIHTNHFAAYLHHSSLHLGRTNKALLYVGPENRRRYYYLLILNPTAQTAAQTFQNNAQTAAPTIGTKAQTNKSTVVRYLEEAQGTRERGLHFQRAHIVPVPPPIPRPAQPDLRSPSQGGVVGIVEDVDRLACLGHDWLRVEELAEQRAALGERRGLALDA